MPTRPLIASVLLAAALASSFLLPKPKYQSLNVLSDLNVPVSFEGWQSVDISDKLNLGPEGQKDDRYNFVSDVFARVYKNERGQELLLLILDAGNFHNPKVCYTSSGFSVRETGDVEFKTGETAFKATSLHMSKQGHDLSMFYWLVIDKRSVGWTGQKITEFWSSLLNRKKAGLMVRLEVPTVKGAEKTSMALGSEFIRALNGHLDPEQKDTLFGRQILPNNYTKTFKI